MPQLQLPIFPAGSKCITDSIAVECRNKQVVYVHGMSPIFQHAVGDVQSFRLITSQLIDSGAARQVDIVDAFGVPLATVKRYLKLLRTHGSKAFFAAPKRRSEAVLKEEVRRAVEALLREGRSVPEVAKATGIRANTLHKAIRAGRLPASQKKITGSPIQNPYPAKASVAKATARH
jgi:transposase